MTTIDRRPAPVDVLPVEDGAEPLGLVDDVLVGQFPSAAAQSCAPEAKLERPEPEMKSTQDPRLAAGTPRCSAPRRGW